MRWMGELNKAGVGGFVVCLKWMGVLDKPLIFDAYANSAVIYLFIVPVAPQQLFLP